MPNRTPGKGLSGAKQHETIVRNWCGERRGDCGDPLVHLRADQTEQAKRTQTRAGERHRRPKTGFALDLSAKSMERMGRNSCRFGCAICARRWLVLTTASEPSRR